MARANRQMKILELIAKNEIDTQEELVAMLREEGFKVTQATVSRDIKDMNILKTLTDDGKRYKYIAQPPKEMNQTDKFVRLFKSTVLSIKSSENLIVLKTETGSASPAAALIDRLDFMEVLGVIAGDDTIFVAVDSVDHTDMIVEKLEDLLEQ